MDAVSILINPWAALLPPSQLPIGVFSWSISIDVVSSPIDSRISACTKGFLLAGQTVLALKGSYLCCK